MPAPVRTVVSATGPRRLSGKVPDRRRSATEIMMGRIVPACVRPAPRHRRGGQGQAPAAGAG
jgi:hypothetical protein